MGVVWSHIAVPHCHQGLPLLVAHLQTGPSRRGGSEVQPLHSDGTWFRARVVGRKKTQTAARPDHRIVGKVGIGAVQHLDFFVSEWKSQEERKDDPTVVSLVWVFAPLLHCSY